MEWIYPVVWFLMANNICCWVIPTQAAEPAMHGEVHSPGYPQPYPASVYQEWELSVPEGYKIQLTFTYMDLETTSDCFYDSVTVMHNRKVLGKFCGQENAAEGFHPGNQPILSPGSSLLLIFASDESNPGPHNHIGFSAFYQAVDLDECSLPSEGSEPLCSQICHNTLGSYMCSCYHGYELRPDQRTCVLQCQGGIYTELEGVLSSPGYPESSPHGLTCQYHIAVEPGYTISLNFSETFHIEHTSDPEQVCPYHWLKMTIPGREPQTLCGAESPGVLETKSHTVELEYHTDWDGLSKGWNLHYTTQRVQCPSPHGIIHGKITPVFPKYLYRDYIQVRCDTGYKLMMNGKEIQGYLSMCKSDGQWHLPLPTCDIIDCGEPLELLNGGIKYLSGSQNQYLSVIEYHCNEPYYSLAGQDTVSYTCAPDRKWRAPDHHNNKNIPTCFPVCGKPTVSTVTHQRILGGSDAPQGAFPWQVFLNTGYRGGAAVIGEQWLLTAAHNLFERNMDIVNVSLVKAYIGDNNVHRFLKTPPLEIAALHPHPEYSNPKGENFNHDIALIKLRERLTFNANVMPLCLPPKEGKYTTGEMGLASGYGKTERDTVTNYLKFIQLPLVDQTICRDSIEEQRKKYSSTPMLTENMICAGFPEGIKDTCGGDSGGAFTLQSNGQHWAAGIISWGINCGTKGTYGVYTNVLNYVDWIKKTMAEN